MPEPTVEEEVQQKLEEVRDQAGVHPQTGRKSAEGREGSVEARAEIEEVECSDCGIQFDTMVTTVGDKRHHFPRCRDQR